MKARPPAVVALALPWPADALYTIGGTHARCSAPQSASISKCSRTLLNKYKSSVCYQRVQGAFAQEQQKLCTCGATRDGGVWAANAPALYRYSPQRRIWLAGGRPSCPERRRLPWQQPSACFDQEPGLVVSSP